MSTGARAAAVWLLVAVASVSGVLALVGGYARHATVDSEQFANRATAAVRDERVRTVVARRVTDDVVLRRADALTAARPAISSAVAAVVRAPAFTRAFRRGVARVHTALFVRGSHVLTLRVADVGTMAAAQLDARRPALAQRVRRIPDAELLRIDVSAAGARAARAARTIRVISWALLALAVLAAAGAVALAGDRRRAVARLGVGGAIAAVALVAGLLLARALVTAQAHGAGERDAARAVWDAFLGDLRNAGLLLGAAGLVVAIAASRRIGRTVAPVAAAALVAGGVALFMGSGGVSTAAPPSPGCNGHRELCDRPLDAIALPATHNSMSVPLPGWFSSEQDAPIAAQLQDGIRGLLIDTHYADRLANGRLRTVLGRRVQRDAISPQLAERARRLRDRLGFGGSGRRGIYLCHSFCELGATALDSVLTDLHDFLVAHPTDVVVVINQDEITPSDFVGAVRRAGLASMALVPSGPWPTLRRMIATGKRVVFLAESRAGGAPWYELAYRALTQETPYAFKRAGQLTDPPALTASCRDNRGAADAPLLLLNHWVTTDPVPLPRDARAVNAYAPLLRRAQTCRRVRHRIPNLVAVNFYRQGDLFRVVDTLNGVR